MAQPTHSPQKAPPTRKPAQRAPSAARPAYPLGQPKTAFIGTLGGKPQVVTFAMDCLLANGKAEGYTIDRAVAVHLAPSDARIARSVQRLRAACEADYSPTKHAQPYPMRFDSVTIRDQPEAALLNAGAYANGRAIASIEDYAAPNAIWLTMHRLITTLKAEGYRIDLCVTGGPRLVGLQTLSAASLLFAPHDRCWHLFTPPNVREAAGEGAMMHAANAAKHSIRLIPVPLLPLGALFPHLQAAAALTPQQIIEQRTQQLSAQELQRCRAVLRGLSPRQRQTLQAFAAGSANVKAVAEKLGIKPSTVDAHKTAIFAACRNTWELPEGEPRHHSFLREKFGGISSLDFD